MDASLMNYSLFFSIFLVVTDASHLMTGFQTIIFMHSEFPLLYNDYSKHLEICDRSYATNVSQNEHV